MNSTLLKETACPHCGSEATVRNGKRGEKQAYICRNCAKTFLLEDTVAYVCHSRISTSDWKCVINDMLSGVSAAETAGKLNIHVSTVYRNRQKILDIIEQLLAENTTVDDIFSLMASQKLNKKSKNGGFRL